jgi:ABC-type nitrate/sulfonate/bicarbonate transport system substrate-binding protein
MTKRGIHGATYRAGIGILSVALLAAAIFALPACTPQNRQIKFLLDWIAGPTFAGLYVEKERGFFQKRGIDIEFVEGTGAPISAQVIGAGSTYFIGIGSGEAVAIARSKGIPVRSVSVLYPDLPTTIISLATDPIRKPGDLVGKTMGVTVGSITVDEYRGLLAKNNIDRSSIREVDVGFQIATPLLQKQVNAVMDYEELTPVQLRLKGHDIVTLRLADYGVKAYSLNIMVNDAALAKEPDTVRAIVDAAHEGYEFLKANPEETAAVFSRLFPEQDKEYVRASIAVVARLLGREPVGRQTRAGWQRTINTLEQLKLLTKNVDVDDVAAKDYTLQGD